MTNLSQHVDEEWPYLLPRIRRLVSGGASSSGGGGDGGTGMAAHVLATTTALGTFHTVTGLTAGQVLKATSATTAAFGVLNHGDLANLTTGDPHTQYLLESNADGPGLAYTGAVLGVGAGAGLTVNAHDVALTTPGSLSVGSTNSSAGSHTHTIDASADVGTTPAAALLKSTAFGGLVLASLGVKGSIDVMSGGDLTVAGSGAYAGSPVLFVDSSGGNVGIMGAPDSQFALDVVGPARAQYFIGPHAIQLKNVLLLSHFDGRQPFETNFTGEPNGHMGQVATVGGGLIFPPGMFGTKAVQVAQAATNLLVNPSFEINVTDGWTFAQDGTGGSVTRSATVGSVAGGFSAQLAPTTSGSSRIFSGLKTVANGETVSASAWVWRQLTGAASIDIYEDGVGTRATATSVQSGLWEYVTCSWTNSTGTSRSVRHRVLNGGASSIWADACQIEIGVPTPYIDGSLGAGHTWSGTAHNSTSTRATSNLQYPTTGNISAVRGTIMAWVWRSASATANDTVVRIAGTSAGFIILRANGTQAEAFWGTAGVAGGTVAAGVWTHLCCTYNGALVRLYVNGVEVANGASSGFSGMPTSMGVGRAAESAGFFLNGRIDDLCILSSTLDANGVRAVYESSAPVFAESSRFSFRATPQGLVWADDEGLWMRDVAGSAVLGVYGGDAAGKSWGGLSLDQGDLLIGNNSKYVKWDASAASLAVKGAITADSGSIEGTLSIGAGGGLVVGTGTKDSTLDGWHIGSTEIVGQVSGADVVTLDTGGITITPHATNSYLKVKSSGVVRSQFLFDYVGSGDQATSQLEAFSGGARRSWVQVGALSPGGGSYQGSVSLFASKAGSGVSLIALEADQIGITGTLVNTLVVGTAADNIARIKPGGSNALNDGGTLNLGTSIALAYIFDNGAAQMGVFLLRGSGNATIEITDTAAIFSATKDTASSINVYWDTSAYFIQNKRGSQRTLSVVLVGASNAF